MRGPSVRQRVVKRAFDIVLACVGLLLTFWLIALAWLLAGLETRSNGFYFQRRVGRNGKLFHVIKIKTMRPEIAEQTAVTTTNDPRITPIGRLLRKSKIDELPQLLNVLIGDMSFVGPRPDVPGFADQLTGDDRIVLSMRPGITGPATLKYGNEEQLLAEQPDPEWFNRHVIYPDKVRINVEYVRNWTLLKDIRYILDTLVRRNFEGDSGSVDQPG